MPSTFKQNFSYAALNHDEGDGAVEHEISPRSIEFANTEKTLSTNKGSRFSPIKIALIALGTLLACVAVFGGLRYVSSKRHFAIEQCGTSPEEARELGCQFDVMSYAWSPPACADSELTAQFIGDGKQWYLDYNLTQEVPFADVKSNKYNLLYVDWDFHLLHCMYMYRKMHRTILRKGPIDGNLDNYHHTAHCEMMVMMKDAGFGLTTEARTKYVECSPLGDYTEHGRMGWWWVIDGKRVQKIDYNEVPAAEEVHAMDETHHL